MALSECRRQSHRPRDGSCTSDQDDVVPSTPAGRRDSVFRDLEEKAVLYPIAVVLFVLWLLGLVGGYTIGAFIHVLLVIALILVLVQFLRGRRVA